MDALAPHWLWLIGGVLLCSAEIIAPGFFLIWVGAAALITGALTGLFGLASAAQFILFALAAIGSVFAARHGLPYGPVGHEGERLNNRTAKLIGQTVVVIEQISPSSGRVSVGDGAWPARGCDAATGTHVTITGVEGNTLIVAPV